MMTDDWRGEHLIRTVERARHTGRNMASPARVRGARDPEVTARRDLVRSLHSEHLTVLEIARRIHIREQTVRDDLTWMKLKANRKGARK